ncbi:uncharacterized protein TEOVI_000421700 [Trypanosoma equiperdum]|uniref:Uncharacterized protein n=2 Tax=Trypanozoon TaxID=39700 RepID=Q583E9_TRYB2|nr:hypothetical protein, conserved [Trypanosoma brucei brucei TREU927]AAX80506.1 hypothetical protein, conserved [Trypanosoma brucei]AAZ11054.1 hypothetical protein, conserved [Trypanosoma brucei brucei TREU927]SCU72639.1 hypothetical protein, conserved [Trypanosoma equiperdum]
MRGTTKPMLFLCSTAVRLNFFPLGLSAGPLNSHILLPRNNFDGRTTHGMKKIQGQSKDPQMVMSRDELKLRCEYCRFEWIHDTLCVRCPAQPSHDQREMWLHSTWMWGKQQPYKYYKYMPAVRNPRTGMPMAREDARGMNNERRGQGLTTRTLNLEKERRGISRDVSRIGQYNTRWKTRFPFPT